MLPVEKLKKKYELIAEEDFDDSLYQGSYGGTRYVFLNSDKKSIIIYTDYSNILSYMGKSNGFTYAITELEKDMCKYNFSWFCEVLFRSSTDFAKKVFQSLGYDCNTIFKNDIFYME